MIKSNWTSFILLLAVIVLLFLLLSKSCEEPVKKDYSKEYQQLMADTTQAGIIRDSLETVIDSLEKIPEEIDKETHQQLAEIDTEVERDSSKDIVYYRSMLELWGWLPDKTDELTHREITLGSKIGVEGNGFK